MLNSFVELTQNGVKNQKHSVRIRTSGGKAFVIERDQIDSS